MSILIIIMKVLIVASYGSILYMLYEFRKNENHAQIKFDLLSSLALSMGMGVALVSLVAVINENTYYFTFVLCCISLLLSQFQKGRMVLAGDQNALIGNHTYRIKDIDKVEARLLWANFYVHNKKHSIYVPLSSREIMAKINK